MSTNAQITNVVARNKALVQAGFERWSSGTGSFFDLLADDMKWTIAGDGPFSKTYLGKEQFMAEMIRPLNARLSALIVPKVREIYADGDTVIALWDATATAKDGLPYKNSYAWFMKFNDGRIVDVVAVLDTTKLLDIWNRIPVPN